jgi:hypothetical protein
MAELGELQLPNCKKMFVPPANHIYWNADYSGADAMVVAADSDCDFLLNFFATSDEKLYVYLAREFLQKDITTSDKFYKQMKAFCHGTNYGMMPAKAAVTASLDMQTATQLRNWYFHKDRCKPILEWHNKIKSEVFSRGYIENIFGARFWLLDRKCPTILNQAYSLIPQSTIAILINKGIVNIFKNETDMIFTNSYNTAKQRVVNPIMPLLQIHDAAAGIAKDLGDEENEKTLDRVKGHLTIPLPYTKPLIIPCDASWSRESYGDCK